MHRGERLNWISHLVGAVAAAVGLAVLVAMSALQGDPWKIVGFSVYGTTLFLLFLTSTLYHSRAHGPAKDLFRRLDHLAIYLLIAGTYTPITLVTLRGAWGWSLFGVVWGLAVVGMLVDLLSPGKHRVVPLIIYLLMGWLSLMAVVPLLGAMPHAGFAWLLLGGVFYTSGIGFYVLDERYRYFHAIWHLFVLAGAVSHYIALVRYVA